jgi:hypothetical protein
VTVPAQPYGSFAPPPRPLRNGVGIVTFALGLMVVFGLVVYAAWLAIAALSAVASAAQHVGGAVAGSTGPNSTGPSSTGPNSRGHGASTHNATAPPVAALPVAATPSGTIMAFDQLWTSHDGNTIVAGAPTVGTSAQTGESVVRVAVTLTNNGEQDWNPVSTTFVGKLGHAPTPESTEGDWMYSTPIVPHTSVTLTKVFAAGTKVFVAGSDQFSLTMRTPHGVALFTGRV